MSAHDTLRAVASAVLDLDADHAWWVAEESHRCEDCGAPAEAPLFACNHAAGCRVVVVLNAIDAHRAAERQLFSPVASAAESAGAVQAEAGDAVGLMEAQR